MSIYFRTRKKTIKVRLDDVDRIIDLASPRVDETRCLECGGRRFAGCSPEIIEHAKDCHGVERSEAVYAIFTRAFKT